MTTPMVSIVISDEARVCLAAHSTTGAMAGGVRLPDGRWKIDIDIEVHAVLRRLDGDISRAVLIACSGQHGRA